MTFTALSLPVDPFAIIVGICVIASLPLRGVIMREAFKDHDRNRSPKPQQTAVYTGEVRQSDRVVLMYPSDAEGDEQNTHTRIVPITSSDDGTPPSS